MNTPITDDYFENRIGRPGEGTPAMLARRLELDRAALMERLCIAEIMTRNLVNDAARNKPWHANAAANLRSAADEMRSALAAARANFPES